MRILHTADWHLGARLVERDRLPEQARFLDWLLGMIASEHVDLLLVAGDVFDAANPPQEAVALYYDFIRRLADLGGTAAVIIGGNHDSASHLNAPRELLSRFRVHVFGSMPEEPGACLREFSEVVVAAVPFLRERDLRQAAPGESALEAHTAVREAIRARYAAVRAAAAEVAAGRPVVAMGHLTALGATTSDSERDIHVGNLGAVGADAVAGFAYTALGHLHRPQRVGGLAHVRFSGSPIPLSFSEVNDDKSVTLIDLGNWTHPPNIEAIPVPVTQRLSRVAVAGGALEQGLEAIADGAWAEVTVRLDTPEPALERRVRDAAGDRCTVLKVLVELPPGAAAPWSAKGAALDELQPLDVFRERLVAAGLPGDEPELTATFQELLALHESMRTA
jgi:exonuclease SbcD